jgi:hypothetical protein
LKISLSKLYNNRFVSWLDDAFKKSMTYLKTKHVTGKTDICLSEHEVALVCLIKNGAYYLDVFLEHHRKIGIKHFLFIDNGSSDETLFLLSRQTDVTAVTNSLPVSIYERYLRAQNARRYIRGGWLLFVDSDELVEAVNTANNDIQDYTKYCNREGYTAVIGQVLDLFSSAPLSKTNTWTFSESVANFKLYSLEHIRSFDYNDQQNVPFSYFLKSNRISNSNIKIKFGGIRKEIFNEDCALTVHRLIKNTGSIRIYTHPHCSSDVACADFSMLIKHYKFAGKFFSREKKQVDENTWNHGEDSLRLARIKGESFRVSGVHERTLIDLRQLDKEEFLVFSDSARKRLKCVN